MALPDRVGTLRELHEVAGDSQEPSERRESAQHILAMADRARVVSTIVDGVQSVADSVGESVERREIAREVLRLLSIARAVAERWGHDAHAELRMLLFEDAVTMSPDEPGPAKAALGLSLDELCEAYGVPMEDEVPPR